MLPMRLYLLIGSVECFRGVYSVGDPVEAAGIEPASRSVSMTASTCVVRLLSEGCP